MAYRLLIQAYDKANYFSLLMIYLKETQSGNSLVLIQVDGILDHESIPVVEKVCYRHLREKKEVRLSLEGLVHISREGRTFLQKMRQKIAIESLPEFMQSEDFGK